MQDGAVLPATGFPRDSGMETRRNVHEANGHGANIGCISYNTCIRSTDGVSGLYLRSVRFRRIEFVEGSRRSRVVVEVDVHGRRGSSGTRSFFGEVLDESNIFGATVVVHGRRGTCRSGLGVDVHRKRSGTRGLRRR